MFTTLLGIAASFFFAFTFLLNKQMESGGSLLWSSSLRFWFMFPMLLILVASRGTLRSSLCHLRRHSGPYLLWSTVEFGFFYAPLTLSAAYAPSWLVAECGQITIIVGPLVASWISGRPVPWRTLRWSLLILVGIAFMLWDQISSVSTSSVLIGFGLVLFAAFMHPFGNRKMMVVCNNEIDTFQRVLNMTLAGLPFWFCVSITGLVRDGFPDVSQIRQSFFVAVFSGVIATLIFFAATQSNPMGLYALYIGNQYAIHGTDANFGIGLRVSHGCIRLRNSDIQELFKIVPVGTRVQFINQPIKVAKEPDGGFWIEVHEPLSETQKDFESNQKGTLPLIPKLLQYVQSGIVNADKVSDALDRRSGKPVRISL